MTDQPAPAHNGASQLWLDLGPVAIYVAAFNILLRVPSLAANAVYIATAIFIAATLAAMAYGFSKTGKISPALWVTGVLVVAFGGLTLAFRDQTFIQLKPTFANAFYAVAILGALAARVNLWKLLFGHAFNLPDRIWTILALRWAGFFLFMALVNETIRRTQSFDFWVNSKLWLVYPLLFAFALANTPLVMKHQQETPTPSNT